MTQWEAVIGLEVHARLLTKSKIFCGCSTEFGAPPNTNVCPVCLGYPGALPTLNAKAVQLAVRMAFATGCDIHLHSQFARKNYFYPDLPKGYQISQFDAPIATNGTLTIRTSNGEKTVRIRRIHMEEDAGKLVHQTGPAQNSDHSSLVDLNRSGVPLIEIVTEPDLRTAEEANVYLTRLRQILMYIDVCDGNMEEGSLRCDANVSVHQQDAELGTRAEVKNLNSFRFLGRAVDFEVARQIAVLERGERVVQETRLFDPVAGETRAMRSKEEAHDYRYFPEPDLLPLRVERSFVEEIGRTLPMLPDDRIRRYESQYGIARGDAETLIATRELADYFEQTAELSKNGKVAANWVKNEVLGLVNEHQIALDLFKVTPALLAGLIRMIDAAVIGRKVAKEVFEEMAESGEAPEAIVARKGLGQIVDPAVIREAAERVLAGNPAQVAQYRAGKANVFGFLVGQLMKETRGKASADLANALLREILDAGSEG